MKISMCSIERDRSLVKKRIESCLWQLYQIMVRFASV